jgi:outer membrane protein OmpA-like peptidoglycan-associated protein
MLLGVIRLHKDTIVRILIRSLTTLLLTVATSAALAQPSPSAVQIIDSLKPTGNLLLGGTRGVRADGVPMAPSAPVRPVPHDPAEPSASLTVNFASGSSDLTLQAIQALNELGRALSSKELSEFKFRIEGHTDTAGTPEANRMLSEQRAQAVVTYIVSHFGVEPTRLIAVGKGEEGLAVQTPPQTPEPRNRRVVVVNLGR